MHKINLVLLTLLCLLLTSCGKTVSVESYAIVPEPVFLNSKEGSFMLDKKTRLYFENVEQNTETAKYITKSLRKMHFRLSLAGEKTKNCIVFSLNDTTNSEIGDEGYLLEVKEDGINISANTETGLFYGFQTLIQMLPEDISAVRYNKITLPYCTILDYPRFEWRGCLRDVSRHFFSVSEIKKQLDLMALYKMNKFHWHLTDDHGWRIEIDKYPELNSIASFRVDRDTIPWTEIEPAREDEPRTYGGFYTKDEIREIVDYAAQLHIDVIPEIEIPGHCAEILEAYPEFGCADDDTVYHTQISPYWPPRAILCGGNDSVMQFLRDVMDEIIPLFPYEYIHIGGDEAWKDNWKKCHLCQNRIKELKLKNEEELQSWMIIQIEDYLSRRGKRIIGWDEILDGGVSKEATVMSWQGYKGAVNAAAHGNCAIMTPTEFCYYNFYQADTNHHPTAMNGMVTLHKAYQFNPIPSGLNEEQQKYILGGQCNLWTEYINNEEQAEYMLLPRFFAMAECLWTPLDRKNWTLFRSKVERQKIRIRALGYNCGVSSFKPILTTSIADRNTFSVTLDWEVEGTQIFYTTDGSEPSRSHGQQYKGAFTIARGATLRTASYLNDTLREEVYSFPIR
ncbi:MAG: family 20 glycosylhydrolase [Bacteroidales bacterium]|nr:family 20 glycosylhydrolase [Bacteroidales bacterium]